MKIVIEHEGLKMVIEPEQIDEFAMSTPEGSLSLLAELDSDVRWEAVDGD